MNHDHCTAYCVIVVLRVGLSKSIHVQQVLVGQLSVGVEHLLSLHKVSHRSVDSVNSHTHFMLLHES